MAKRAFQVSGILTLDMQRFTLGMQKASRDLGTFQRSWQKSFGAMRQSLGTLPGGAGGILAGLGLSLSIKEAVQAADAYQALQRRLQYATQATGDYARVSQSVYDISQKTYVKLEDTARTFIALQQAGKDFGATNGDILKVVDAVNKLGVMGGSSAEQLSGAMLQFSQVMGKGKLMAQELNIIAENMLPLAVAIKQGLGMTMGELRKQMDQGKVSAEMVFNAIIKQSKRVDSEFGSFIPSLSNNITRMKNEFSKIIGENNAAPIKALGEAIGFVTRNMDSFIRGGAMVAMVAGLNMARMALGSYYGMLESTVSLWNKASGAIANAARAKVDMAAATRLMTVEEVKSALEVEKLARSKGVYLSFSESVRAAEAKRVELLKKGGDIFRQSQTEQQAFAAKAAAAASSWAVKVEAAEQRVAKATEAANYQRNQARVSLTGGDAKAMEKAIKAEELAMANLTRVREAAAASAVKYDARAAKLAEASAKKNAEANVAYSAAAQEAMLLKAREVAQMEAANRAGLAAKAIKDGETAAVVRNMRVLDLDTAARARNNAAMTMGQRIGQLTTASMGLMRAAGTGLLTLLGGWPGVIFAAVTALAMFGDKLDWITGKQGKAAKALHEYLQQQKEFAKTEAQRTGDKIYEAQKELIVYKAQRSDMPSKVTMGAGFGGQIQTMTNPEISIMDKKITQLEADIKEAQKRMGVMLEESKSGPSNAVDAQVVEQKQTNDLLKTVVRQTRPQIGMNTTPRTVY